MSYDVYASVKAVKVLSSKREWLFGAPECRLRSSSPELRFLQPIMLVWEERLGLDVLNRCFGQRQSRPERNSYSYNTFALHFWVRQLPGEAFSSRVSPGALKWRIEIMSAIIQAKHPFFAGISWICFGLIYADDCLQVLFCFAYKERCSQVRQTSLFVFSCLCSSNPYRLGNDSQSVTKS